MKKVYIEPKTEVFTLNNESALCAGTAPGAGGQVTHNEYEDITTKPIGEEDEDVPITAKGSDFFEESISPRSLWGDDEE